MHGTLRKNFQKHDRAYLWKAGDCTDDPGKHQHDFSTPTSIHQAQGMNYGEVAIHTDSNEHERWQVKAENPKEHQDPAADVSSSPRNCDVPTNLHGHHDECDDQVWDGQMHYKVVNARSSSPVFEQNDEDCWISHGWEQKKHAVQNHRHHRILIEQQFRRCSENTSVDRPVQDGCTPWFWIRSGCVHQRVDGEWWWHTLRVRHKTQEPMKIWCDFRCISFRAKHFYCAAVLRRPMFNVAGRLLLCARQLWKLGSPSRSGKLWSQKIQSVWGKN